MNLDQLQPYFPYIWKMGMVLTILLLTVIAQKFVKRLINKRLERITEDLKVDATKYNFLKYFLTVLIYLIGIGLAIYTIPSLRSLAVSLFAGAGIFAAILGFGAQQAFSNIVSGIFIVIFKPFRVWDRIEIGELYNGVVEDISLRHTVIRNYENKRIIIPNHVISEETVVNLNISDQRICHHVEFGISRDSDMDKALSIMEDEAIKHPYCIDKRTPQEVEQGQPQVRTRVMGFGDSSVTLRAYVWTEDPLKAFYTSTDLNKSIKERFDQEGIEIPFPYRTVVFKNNPQN